MSTPLSAQEPQRAVRPRTRPLASRAAFGFGTGIALGVALGSLAWLSDQLEYPYSALIPANMIGAWVGLGFILGASAKTVPTGALRGLIGLLSAVGAYYLLISLSEAGFRLIGAPHAATTWGAVGADRRPDLRGGRRRLASLAGNGPRPRGGRARRFAHRRGSRLRRAAVSATSAASCCSSKSASGWSFRLPCCGPAND